MKKNVALWGGGFDEGMHPALAAISDSLDQDMPLADADLRASQVYARALGRCGVLSAAQGEQLATTLESMRQELHAGTWVPGGVEDIHTAIEAEVTRRLGELGERLHTGRSRNDQVSTAFRLATYDLAQEIIAAIQDFQSILVQRAESEIDTLVPAYTHVQRAQPIRLAHWIMGFFWPMQRDIARMQSACERILQLPLGSGAVSGHPFGLDREWVAEQLGFRSVTENSLDTVGDRDFAIEFAFVCAMVATHLSRMAEELVMWSSTEFGYVKWPDALASGSSLMPNKKNPDLAELVRGRVASSMGDLLSLLVLVKGLPSSYQRDLQEDKAPVWRTARAVLASVRAMTAALHGIRFDTERMGAALTDDVLATEAADVLVARGVPFRQAYKAVAQTAAQARKLGVGIKAVATSGGTLPAPLQEADLHGLHVEAAVERRTALGGTARQAIMVQIEQAQAALRGSKSQ